MVDELKFSETIYVSHYDHSSEDSPSLNANLTEADACDESEETRVAEYKLVRVRKLVKKVTEVL